MDENIVAEEQVQQVALQSEPPTDEVVSQEVVASAVTVDVDKTLYVSFFFNLAWKSSKLTFFDFDILFVHLFVFICLVYLTLFASKVLDAIRFACVHFTKIV